MRGVKENKGVPLPLVGGVKHLCAFFPSRLASSAGCRAKIIQIGPSATLPPSPNCLCTFHGFTPRQNRIATRPVDADTDDGAISGVKSQGGRLPVILPDGRFFRTVLRRCTRRCGNARYRADFARRIRRQTNPDVRRSGSQRRRLSRSPHQRRPPSRDCRADRKPRGRQSARRIEDAGCTRHCPVCNGRNAD